MGFYCTSYNCDMTRMILFYFRMLSGYLEILERKAMKLMPSLQVKR